jgi:hypothetical protein
MRKSGSFEGAMMVRPAGIEPTIISNSIFWALKINYVHEEPADRLVFLLNQKKAIIL